MSQKVSCDFCRKSFGTPFQYYKHANKAHPEDITNDEWLACDRCELVLPSEDALNLHKIQNHTHSNDKPVNQERVQCQLCSETLCSIQQYYKHANKVHIKQLENSWHCCQVCNFYLPTIMALTNHKGKAHISNSGTSLRLQCIFCSDIICSPQQYYKHANKEHHDEVVKLWHQCPICLFYLPTRGAVTKHSGKAHKAKFPNQCTERIPCKFCPETLCSLQQYYKHANKEHFDLISNDWYMCSICNFFLPTVVVLTNHRGRAHAPMKNGTSKKITCSFCPEVFRASDVYHAHANNCHLDIIVEKWQIHCKICRIYFPTSVLLKRHKEQFHSNLKGVGQAQDVKVTFFTEATIEVTEVTTTEIQ